MVRLEGPRAGRGKRNDWRATRRRGRDFGGPRAVVAVIWRATRRRGRESQWIIHRHFAGRDDGRPSNSDLGSLPILEGYVLSWPRQTTKS